MQARLIMATITDIEKVTTRTMVLGALSAMKGKRTPKQISDWIFVFYHKKIDTTAIRGRLHSLLAAGKVKRHPVKSYSTKWSMKR